MRGVFSLLVVSACAPQHEVEPPTVEVRRTSFEPEQRPADLVVLPVVRTRNAPNDWPSGRQTVHERRTVHTAEATPVAVYSELDGPHVRLWMQWGDADAVVIDAVQTNPVHAAQSARSLFDVAIAAHGMDAVAVAWRPLVDASNPQAAELRWAVLEPGDSPLWRADALTAQQLGATTGVGPYSYADSRLRAVTAGDRGVFVWVGDDGVRAVRADTTQPVDVPLSSTSELMVSAEERSVLVTGHDYWCEDGQTHSSSCRSMEQVYVQVP